MDRSSDRSLTPQLPRANRSTQAPIVGCGARPWHHQYSDLLLKETHSDTSSYNTPVHAHKSPRSVQSYGAAVTEISCNQTHGHATNTVLCHLDFEKLESKDGIYTNSLRRPLAWLWMVLATMLFGSNLICALQPYWIVNTQYGTAFGLVNYCLHFTKCKYYKQTAAGLTLDEAAWKIGLALYIVGCAQLGISAFLAVVNLCIAKPHVRHRITLLGGYMQVFSVVFTITALIILPVGFGNARIRSICGQCDIYSLQGCSIGWTYILAIVTVLLTCMLPLLSHYVDLAPFLGIGK